MLTAKEAAGMIDISAVRTHSTLADIERNVELARQYRFINVHVLPNWVRTLAGMLKDIDGVYVGSPVGFPSGGHTTKVKLLEAEGLLEDGVQEMDIVMNVGRFLNREYGYVLDELKQIIRLADKRVMTKVIIEINNLNDEQMADACKLVIDSGADFVKTGTGWVPGTANIERCRKMKEVCGSSIKVKAAGGIRTREDFLQLYEMGVERMGINTDSAISIVKSFEL